MKRTHSRCYLPQPLRLIAATCLILLFRPALAVDSVNPTGVNVRSNGATTVFLTFRGTAGQRSTDAFWCGEITVPANTVTTTNPCVPGTLFGHLPRALDKSRPSGALSTGGTIDVPTDVPPTDLPPDGPTDLPLKPRLSAPLMAASNLTDVMTIPPSVARRAMQSARKGDNSSFFYVRKFEAQGQTQFIAVTCRMAGGGARVPFALIDVRPYFVTDEGKVPVHLAALGEALPQVSVALRYNGSGRLKGRWEIVRPGDTAPEAFDLLPEASLPIEQRGLQKRYSIVSRFDEFLPATGELVLQGPSAEELRPHVVGPYQLLLRVEATRDKEGDSNTGEGVVASGGVAGFSIPPLRFYVATEDEVSKTLRSAGKEKNIILLTPKTGKFDPEITSLDFSWGVVVRADLYLFELQAPGENSFQAVLTSQQTQYSATPWILDALKQYGNGRWRVSALDKSGKRIGRSDWQILTKEKGTQ